MGAGGKTMKFTKEQILDDILEREDLIEVKEWGGKHDVTWRQYVIKWDDGKHYMFEVAYSYNNGIEDYYGFDADEVEPYEVTVTKWRKVKK